MGLMDFFKKGKERPAENKTPQAGTRPPTSPGTQTSGVNPGAPSRRDYVVQSGDSLSKIARQFYGNANDWEKIYQANKDTIKDPNLIHPGQKIIIP